MEYSSPTSHVDEVFKSLVLRINPPRVTMDNASNKNATLIKVDSANRRGCLLNVVQVIADLNLIITRAYIASDGGWFMDVFHVTDELGNKVYADDIPERIQQSLRPKELSVESDKSLILHPALRPKEQSVESDKSLVLQSALRPKEQSVESNKSLVLQPAVEHTTIELSGIDRPGLLSEIFAVLTDHKCNVLAAYMWTHNSRMASVVHITDESKAMPIDDPNKLDNIKQLLLYVLKGNRDKHSARTAVAIESTHTERRLHQIMYADRDYDNIELNCEGNEQCKPLVTIEDCSEKDYTVLNVISVDRPKLIFDTVCTITDMQYVISHGTIVAEGPVAQQEYFIRHMDGSPISSEPERERVIKCLEAAIKRRSFEGIRLELCGDDKVGLLADVTRVFRENGLTVKRAEITTKGAQAVNVFYVADTSGCPVKSETIEAIKKEIGVNVVNVKDETLSSSFPPQQPPHLSFGYLFRSRSEKVLFSLGLIKTRPSEVC